MISRVFYFFAQPHSLPKQILTKLCYIFLRFQKQLKIMSNEDVISFKQLLSETIRNVLHFMHCPKDGPKLKWESITEKDFRIMKGALSENVYYSENLNNFMTDIIIKIQKIEMRTDFKTSDLKFMSKVRVILKEKAFMSSKL